MKSIGRLSSLCAVLALSFRPIPQAFAEGKPALVTVGYVDLVNAQIIAKKQGLVEKALGVPVKWVKFDSGGDVNRAVAAGQIDFGSVGNPPATIGITRGLPYRGIMALDVLGPVEALVVRKAAGITSVADLAGKTITAPFGSTTHYLLMTALKTQGLDPSHVKVLDLAPPDAFAAWQRGDIDAAYIWEPIVGKMVASGGTILLDSGAMAAKGYPTWDVAVVMNDFATKYPTIVQNYVRAECAAIDYWTDHPKETAELIAHELSMPVGDTARMIAGTKEVPCPMQTDAAYLGTSAQKGKFVDTLVSTAEFLKSQNRLPEAGDRATYAAFVDPSFLQAVVAH
jgi:taurine transport system substrate-binding protein